MGLADYTPARETVEFKGGSMTIRGVALDDVALLMRGHLPDIDALVEIFAKQVPSEIETVAFAQHAMALVREAPGLVANLIALAADEPDCVAQARSLPLPVQITLVEKIGRLTFEESGGPKNFFESLGNLFRSVSPALSKTGLVT